MRAAILARVSTELQATDDRNSLPMQRRMMEAYAVREGLEVCAVFEIPGESAWTSELASRPQFVAAIEAAERREFEVLLVYDLSRFARDQRVLHECLYRLRRAGVRLIGVHNGLDYTSEEGRDWAGIEGVFAERASREQSRRIRHAYDQRFERGLSGGDVPFGYERVASDRPWRVVEAEAEAVRWGFEQYALGTGFLAIASEWNRRGLRPHSKRGLQSFGVSSVQRIIESRLYCGFISHLGQERLGAHEAIVSVEEWARAQLRTRRQAHGPRSDYSLLLAGVAECADCGGPLWSKAFGKRGRAGVRRVYYWEPSRVRGRSCAAGGLSWRGEDVDAEVDRAVLTMGADERWFEEAAELAVKATPRVDVSLERSRLLAKRERLGLAMAEGMLSPERARLEVSKVDAELTALPVDGPKVFAAGERFRSIAEAWEGASLAARRELVRIVFESVQLDIRAKEVSVVAAEEFAPLLAHRVDYVEREGRGTPDRTRMPLLPSPRNLFRLDLIGAVV